MQPSNSGEHIAAATPADVARMVPSRPLLCSESQGWNGVVLQRYQHPPGRVEIAAVRDHVLVINLAGPTLVEDKRRGGGFERRWADAGHFSLTPAGWPVDRVLKGRPEALLVHIAPAFVDEIASEIYDVDAANVDLHPCLAVRDEKVNYLGKLLLDEAEAGGPGSALAAHMLTGSLVVHLLRSHSSLGSDLPEPPAPTLPGRLRRVVDHMQAHMDEAMPLAELAQLSGLSQPQFARAFRQASGEPPHRFLIGLRVKRACDLLEQTELSVIEIGLRCGFEQPNHFATAFRKLMGMSPRAWRTTRRLQ